MSDQNSLEHRRLESDNSSSTGSEDEDNNWDDWVEDDIGLATQSLFEDRQFSSAEAALNYDKDTHGFDLVAISTKLGSWKPQSSRSGNILIMSSTRHTPKIPIDQLHPRSGMDLDWIFVGLTDTATKKPSPKDLASLQGTEPFFTDDAYLIPIIEDDPILREHFHLKPKACWD